jgi:RNA polymerase sigma factor (sigma-70 family)
MNDVKRKGSVRIADPVIEPLLRTTSETERRREIESLLVNLARPLVRRVLSRFMRQDDLLQREDADDIESTVMLRLVSKLEAAATSAEDVVDNFESYVATLTYNTTYDFLRRCFPQRTRLKNRLRYVLTHDSRFSASSTGKEQLYGLSTWYAASITTAATGLQKENASPAMLDQTNPADALVAILGRVQRRMSLDALAEVAGELWSICDSTPASRDVPADAQPSPLAVLEMREFLQTLWREIQALRPLQRQALLLNLRDGDSINVLSLFVLTGIATFDEVAVATTMAPESLAAIWNDLPLADSRIAESMHLTRQQVINLRKSARERLARCVLGRKKRIET